MSIALLVIDVQKEYQPDGALPAVDIDPKLKKIQAVLEAVRSANLPIFHIKHIEADDNAEAFVEGSDEVEFIDGFEPRDGEFEIIKHVPGAIIHTALKQQLETLDIETVVIVGFSSFLCCDTTTREAAQLGYDVLFIDDAIGEFELEDYSAPDIHKATCAILSESGFCEVITSEEFINRLS